ncbi:brachyurin [Drosophila obscura]|uniref:brachyurin n=1 Tax=Drosophila obscura TaxID=7282 RepID=UPI001BB0D970|nr:brachyurin [Drosophila obscura]
MNKNPIAVLHVEGPLRRTDATSTLIHSHSNSMENHQSITARFLWPLLLVLILVGGLSQSQEWKDQTEDDDDSADDETIMERRWQVGYEQYRILCEKFEQKKKEDTPAVSTRIAGGELADAGMFPYQVGLIVQLTTGDLIQCGGSLVTLQYVLTAAHCLTDAVGARVYLGALELAERGAAAEEFLVSEQQFRIYPGYLGFGAYNDLALIRLPRRAIPSDRVQTIALAGYFMQQKFLERQPVTVSGWGSLGDSAVERTRLLHYVDVEVLDQERCMCSFLPGLVSTRRHLCTDGRGGRGACEGDSGGPLVYQWQNVSHLIGVTSFGSSGGCELGAPTVYTRITAYLPWIRQQTGMTN